MEWKLDQRTKYSHPIDGGTVCGSLTEGSHRDDSLQTFGSEVLYPDECLARQKANNGDIRNTINIHAKPRNQNRHFAHEKERIGKKNDKKKFETKTEIDGNRRRSRKKNNKTDLLGTKRPHVDIFG